MDFISERVAVMSPLKIVSQRGYNTRLKITTNAGVWDVGMKRVFFTLHGIQVNCTVSHQQVNNTVIGPLCDNLCNNLFHMKVT